VSLDYLVVYRFGFNSGTSCKILDGPVISPSDVLDGINLGIYECRMKRSPVVTHISRFSHNNEIFTAAITVTGLFAIFGVIFAK